jgi:hypothetical protein
VTISPAQENLIEQVRIAHTARLNARVAAEAEAKQLVARRVAAAAEVESRAVRTAMAGGVSRRRVGIEGLGTSDYHSVTKVLDVTRSEFEEADARSAERLRQVHIAEKAERELVQPTIGEMPAAGVPVARVDWAGYSDGVDLRGYVRLADSGDYWIGLVDETDPVGSPGDGPLWSEARAKGRLADRLAALLNEF